MKHESTEASVPAESSPGMEADARRTSTQRKLMCQAVCSALLHTLFRLAICALILWSTHKVALSELAEGIIRLILVLNLLLLIPIWITLVSRLKEIKGGELDAARQY